MYFTVMRLLLRNPNLSSALQSISSRILLSILLTLPQISPASLSPYPSIYPDLLQLVHQITSELGSGTTSVMSKSLGLVVRTTTSGEDYGVCPPPPHVINATNFMVLADFSRP